MSDAKQLILLVDDDPDFLNLTQRILERAGYRVACAADPESALRSMAGERPDLVITDLMMAALNSGFSFARQIKQDKRFAGIPVILITAAASRIGFDFRPRTQAELAAMSVDAFLEKPAPPDALVRKVQELLKSSPSAPQAQKGPQ